MPTAPIGYCFTEQDSQRAYEGWGANCGPNALAFACRLHLDAVQGLIPGFEQKRYTNPTMMKAALAKLGRRFTDVSHMCRDGMALARIQWGGRWLNPGVPARVAYQNTHWVACWREAIRGELVFDVNGGIQTLDFWMRETVPLLTRAKGADGTWFPTHVWRLAEVERG